MSKAIIFLVFLCIIVLISFLDVQQYKPQIIFVEGGLFEMGNTFNSSKKDDDESVISELPIHKVKLDDYNISKYEVTVGEFSEFIKETNYKTTAEIKGYDDIWSFPGFSQDKLHPVTCVSWYDAIHFCNWKSLKEGLQPVYTIDTTKKDPTYKYIKINDDEPEINWLVIIDWNANGYRLPTEAEWEYAAKGGKYSNNYLYSGGNDISLVGYLRINSNYEGTTKVGLKKQNELGLYDMSGNVWEWCWDYYKEYSKELQINPKGPKKGSSRIFRGGSWGSSSFQARSSYRGCASSDGSAYYFGFRVAKNK